MPYFTHLHVHSHFSILDGMSKVPDLIKKCKKNGMYAMALTDHGNMFGIKELVDNSNKENGKVKDKIKELEAEKSKVENTPTGIISPEDKNPSNDENPSEGENTPAVEPPMDEEAKAAKLAELDAEIGKLKGQIFKPIIGIETYCAHRTLYDKDANIKERDPETGRDRITDRSGWHLILLAKNKKGYLNLCKLSSIAFTDGYFYSPRIDHNVLEKYHEGLICCSACIGGEIPQKILKGDIEEAEKAVRWFKNLFGDDFYLEMQRHKTNKPNAAYDTYPKQQTVNRHLVDFAQKYDIKLIATNDVHFVEEEHGEAHDRLICLSTGKDFDDPNRLHYTKQEWLKSPDEMAAIFEDIPEALENTREIVDKVEVYSIDSDPIMPMFDIPASFGSEEEYRSRITEQELFDEFTRNEKGEVVMSQEAAEKKIKKLGGYNKLYRIKFEADYLAKLVWEGARKRYLSDKADLTDQSDSSLIKEALTDEQRERIIFELHTIKTMGFPGYFLIVADYIRGAREELGVSVGPGRGSAAGSVVAYCLWITDIDPLKYDLLFERFLNPDRISLPDIDVDFDDAGRGKVLDWITEKYGKEKVAHIITYGTMASKSAIADVARVQKIPLSTVAQIKSYIPDRGFPDNIKDEKGKSPKVNLKNCYKYVPELREIMEGADSELKEVLTYAEELEDTNRQTGIHACGVIIGADDLTNFAPMCTIKDKDSGEDVLVTQYDGHVVETVGLIKMDFLGLKNLSIIKDAIKNIKNRHGIEIDIDHIPIDDELTYQLFCKGNTVGTFQFESAGMQKYLRELEPHVFEDLIAMNALYRPGPMDYIPDFINRKQGRAPIEYDIPCMEKYLKDTYGITVYQEQVMLLSRQLAGFTRGQSDTLRKAMGKKQIEKMNELEVLFYEGGEKNGHPHEILHKIWEDWKKFASYAFNKSHATCYSWVAYQTAYLKAHYPAEYMAAVMTSSLSDITRVTELMEDCRKNKIDILAPCVNESEIDFSVNEKGQIRFGLSAIKGMGEAAAQAIIDEREAHGPFVDIFDLLDRVDMKAINRKNLEVLVKSGAMDQLKGLHRAQYMHKDVDSENAPSYLEKLIRWQNRKRESASIAQMSIFDMSEEMKAEDHPQPPVCEPWTSVEQCSYEKEVVGFYLTGHPLDDYKYEMENFVTINVSQLNDLESLVPRREVRFGGIVTAAMSGISQKTGRPYGSMTIEDYEGSYELRLFGEDGLKYREYCQKGLFVFVKAEIKQYTIKKDGVESKSPARIYIDRIMPLGDVVAQFTKSINFHIDIRMLNEEFCTRLKKLAHQNRGKTKLTVNVDDKEHEMSLFMSSNDMSVDPAPFIALLKNMPEVYGIKLNNK
ncbi:MAG: DNA polymerase III subunit alpha [Bacteroidales bacterium]|nr:DNA polymerase III subunit alpha [Bacteroidales bacterium]